MPPPHGDWWPLQFHQIRCVCDADFFWFFNQNLKNNFEKLKNVNSIIFTPNLNEFERFINKINDCDSSFVKSVEKFLDVIEEFLDKKNNNKKIETQIDKRDDDLIKKELTKNIKNQFSLSKEKLEKFTNSVEKMKNLNRVVVSNENVIIHRLIEVFIKLLNY